MNISIEDLYAQQHELVTNVVKSHLRMRRETWEDTEQNIWLSAVGSFPSFRGDSDIKTWFYLIIFRRIADVLRKEYRREGWVYPARETVCHNEHISWLESKDEFEHLLLACPFKYRGVIRERLLYGKRLTEIAADSGKTYAETSGLYRRGIKAMRGKLECDI